MSYEVVKVPLGPGYNSYRAVTPLDELWRDVWSFVTGSLSGMVHWEPNARGIYHRYFDELLPENEERMMRHSTSACLSYSFWDFGGQLSMSMGVASRWFRMAVAQEVRGVRETCAHAGYALDLERLVRLDEALGHAGPPLLATRTSLFAVERDGDSIRIFDDEQTLTGATPDEIERARQLLERGGTEDPIQAEYTRRLESTQTERRKEEREHHLDQLDARIFQVQLGDEIEHVADAFVAGDWHLADLLERMHDPLERAQDNGALVFGTLLALHAELTRVASPLSSELMAFIDDQLGYGPPAQVDLLWHELVEYVGLTGELAWFRALQLLDRKEADAIDALAIALQIDGNVERHVTPESIASELEAARAKVRVDDGM